MSSEIMYSEIQQTETLPAPPVIVGPDGSERSLAPEPSASSEHAALFPVGDMDNFRGRWRDIQGDFVDEPRKAVEQANELVEQVIQRLTDCFCKRALQARKRVGAGKDVSTEDLRQALRRYRSFFDRPPVRLSSRPVTWSEDHAAICRQPPIRIDWLIPIAPVGLSSVRAVGRCCQNPVRLTIDELVSCDREFAL